eukprot:ctg_2533.g571
MGDEEEWSVRSEGAKGGGGDGDVEVAPGGGGDGSGARDRVQRQLRGAEWTRRDYSCAQAAGGVVGVLGRVAAAVALGVGGDAAGRAGALAGALDAAALVALDAAFPGRHRTPPDRRDECAVDAGGSAAPTDAVDTRGAVAAAAGCGPAVAGAIGGRARWQRERRLVVAGHRHSGGDGGHGWRCVGSDAAADAAP